MSEILSKLDKVLGDGLNKTIVAHHDRRLRRIGWERAIDPPSDEGIWAAGDPPPRKGNKIEVLVDGSAAFPTFL